MRTKAGNKAVRSSIHTPKCVTCITKTGQLWSARRRVSQTHCDLLLEELLTGNSVTGGNSGSSIDSDARFQIQRIAGFEAYRR